MRVLILLDDDVRVDLEARINETEKARRRGRIGGSSGRGGLPHPAIAAGARSPSLHASCRAAPLIDGSPSCRFKPHNARLFITQPPDKAMETFLERRRRLPEKATRRVESFASMDASSCTRSAARIFIAILIGRSAQRRAAALEWRRGTITYSASEADEKCGRRGAPGALGRASLNGRKRRPLPCAAGAAAVMERALPGCCECA